ncbi:type II toxin-antitoxin system RelE/ParE family toxin [Mannheimia haemolytica]|uniref:type II toxin-antitoxin system RelE/ParE family toxin n=1 Tax=Mannheimia haemolytica TaxID=75985 RepID=UPI0001BCFFA0|nr:type II toxin-antitoxin system RelE/ParE family toxin [Mannheimia haemolytica]EEY09427.1 addiction module killer protein [Mannheimia haemolytica serotype A2 str. OVINE]MDW0536862.1 type II toxin-antitoxin system RelE/ParE family toxin [Mannheimia haemolytica]MDW0575328.1 type II toxin-antitoxin system RelE/ParE family toxin [Mannheimia haemolytica]MDW0644782.1 type II toxin-antitoxin system RelE/ParE family toxin [Mannheimia haemolytica]MDW0740659.1 type II toxin-antitoxin system RelE/ParE 
MPNVTHDRLCYIPSISLSFVFKTLQIGGRMYHIERTEIFDQWLENLKDPLAVVTIARRIERAESGNFGDTKYIAEGISEMRLNVSKGYRLYYAQKGSIIYILLNGGYKGTPS